MGDQDQNQRFLYAHSNAREITILAAFRKETRKTPKDALRLAHHRARRLRP
ncbi:MAG: type II toxin-antitoxin system RelE/ParE family toxin [Myxococcales bacterium]|nr:type II toxin-antitoxin system RelE/ParE family toxin [Myxococcales bacterium]